VRSFSGHALEEALDPICYSNDSAPREEGIVADSVPVCDRWVHAIDNRPTEMSLLGRRLLPGSDIGDIAQADPIVSDGSGGGGGMKAGGLKCKLGTLASP
jgi:hypothetical protein